MKNQIWTECLQITNVIKELNQKYVKNSFTLNGNCNPIKEKKKKSKVFTCSKQLDIFFILIYNIIIYICTII